MTKAADLIEVGIEEAKSGRPFGLPSHKRIQCLIDRYQEQTITV